MIHFCASMTNVMENEGANEEMWELSELEMDSL